MHYRLRNVSTYQAENKIYVADGDHNLIEISGDSVESVTAVLNVLETTSDPDDIYQKVKSTLSADREMFDQILHWLHTNHIIERINNGEALSKKTIPTFIHTTHLTEAERQKVFQTLTSTKFEFIEAEKEAAKFILVVAPIFDQYSSLASINEFAYEANIPICHIGIDSETFTLGPLSYPHMHTPCLKCYSQRKISNLKNPKRTIEFIRYADKKKISGVRIGESPYFFTVLLTYLKMELEKFFYFNGMYCEIVGKSLMFDHFNYEITKSRVLKIPGCPVCNSEVLVAPLNP
jgi:hypothetical protein